MLTNNKDEIKQYEEVSMIANVFRKNGINLIYGATGLGKTISSIKAVNEDGIVPILLDFDENLSPEENGCNYIHIDGYAMMSNIEDNRFTIPTGRVIVIDTWHNFEKSGGSIELIKEFASNGNTIIVIAHIIDIATKRDIPDMPSYLVNHFSSKLFLAYDAGSRTKGNEREPSVNLEILKCRGYKYATRTLVNWMRPGYTPPNMMDSIAHIELD